MSMLSCQSLIALVGFKCAEYRKITLPDVRCVQKFEQTQTHIHTEHAETNMFFFVFCFFLSSNGPSVPSLIYLFNFCCRKIHKHNSHCCSILLVNRGGTDPVIHTCVYSTTEFCTQTARVVRGTCKNKIFKNFKSHTVAVRLSVCLPLTESPNVKWFFSRYLFGRVVWVLFCSRVRTKLFVTENQSSLAEPKQDEQRYTHTRGCIRQRIVYGTSQCLSLSQPAALSWKQQKIK